VRPGNCRSPRHRSLFGQEAETLPTGFRVSCVAADTSRRGGSRRPDRQNRSYYRLQGRPRPFYSHYRNAFLKDLAVRSSRDVEDAEVRCMFSNTATSAGLVNGLCLGEPTGSHGVRSVRYREDTGEPTPVCGSGAYQEPFPVVP